MKQLIIVSTILDIVELALLTVCYEFFIAQYRFSDYMEELYLKFGFDMGDDSTGNNITYKFQQLFNDYQDLAPLGNFLATFITLALLIITYIFMISFMITYLCHFRKRSCCKCKKACSYICLIFAMILSFPYIFFVYYAKTKINLPEEEIYQFDYDFNQKTRKNIKFMKKRKIILIVCISLLYAIYIIHTIILCVFNKKLIMVDDNTNTNNVVTVHNEEIENNVNNNADNNQVEVLTTKENKIVEK